MTILKPKFILFFILIAAAAFFYSVKGESMSLFGKGEKVCLFSGFDGKITLNGEPAGGATVMRKVIWIDEKGESQEIIANEQGEFSFSSWWDIDKRKFIPQFVVHQSIFVSYEGQEYQIWGSGKSNTHEFSEFGGKQPKNFRCELTDDIRRVERKDLDSEIIGTNCYW